MGEYSNSEIASRIRQAQTTGWKALSLSRLGIRDSDIKHLVCEKGAKQVQSLHLGASDQITDAGIKALVESCPNLQSLDLAWCRRITDTGVKSLVESCPNLQSLGLGWCK